MHRPIAIVVVLASLSFGCGEDPVKIAVTADAVDAAADIAGDSAGDSAADTAPFDTVKLDAADSTVGDTLVSDATTDASTDASSDASSDASTDASTDASSDAVPADVSPADVSPADVADTASGPEGRCLDTGGSVAQALCCQSTSDFPSSCAIGPCGCAPNYSHTVQVCQCPSGTCFDPAVGCKGM